MSSRIENARSRSNGLLQGAGTSTTDLTQLANAAILVGLIGIFGVIAVKGPLAGLLIVGAVALVILAVRCPEYGLAFGATATLAGGSFAFITSWGIALLSACACLSVIGLLARQAAPPWPRLLLAALVLVWLALRVGLEGDVGVLRYVLGCVAALVLVLDCVQRGRNFVRAFSLSGAAFIAASAAFGQYGESASRFEGISGNPNRMAFGLLVLLPFLCSLVVAGGRLAVRCAALVAVAGAILFVFRSGSAQGLVGLAAVGIVFLVCWATRWPTWLKISACCVGLGMTMFLIEPAIEYVRASPDLMTLSGRTPIYSAALDEIMRSPWVGSGRQHFYGGGGYDRSAHSVTLAFAVTGGIALGLAWIAVLVVLGRAAGLLARHGSLLAAVPVVLIVVQVVQTIHLLPYSWAIVGVLMVIRHPADLFGAASPDPRRARSPLRPGSRTPIHHRQRGPRYPRVVAAARPSTATPRG